MPTKAACALKCCVSLQTKVRPLIAVKPGARVACIAPRSIGNYLYYLQLPLRSNSLSTLQGASDSLSKVPKYGRAALNVPPGGIINATLHANPFSCSTETRTNRIAFYDMRGHGGSDCKSVADDPSRCRKGTGASKRSVLPVVPDWPGLPHAGALVHIPAQSQRNPRC